MRRNTICSEHEILTPSWSGFEVFGKSMHFQQYLVRSSNLLEIWLSSFDNPLVIYLRGLAAGYIGLKYAITRIRHV